MKMFPDTSVIYLHKAPVDFRKGINGLSFIVEQNMNLNPFSEVLFVFCNRTRDKLKVKSASITLSHNVTCFSIEMIIHHLLIRWTN